MIRLAFAFPVLVLGAVVSVLACTAEACPPVVKITHAKPVLVAPTVVTPFVAAVAVQPVLVPLYGASYYPTPPAPERAPVRKGKAPPPEEEEEDCCDDVKTILAELKSLRAEVAALRGEGGPRPVTDAAPTPRAIPLSACVACHGARSAEEKGGGFVLVEKDGSPSVLSAAERRRVVARVEKGQMPPPPAKLDDVAKAKVLALFRKGE